MGRDKSQFAKIAPKYHGIVVSNEQETAPLLFQFLQAIYGKRIFLHTHIDFVQRQESKKRKAPLEYGVFLFTFYFILIHPTKKTVPYLVMPQKAIDKHMYAPYNCEECATMWISQEGLRKKNDDTFTFDYDLSCLYQSWIAGCTVGCGMADNAAGIWRSAFLCGHCFHDHCCWHDCLQFTQ